ncbi:MULTISPECIES: APC family permease [Arthrobacter]|uniref:APC family permease n=1 Tax=Arthrobacter oryzae TaxID=409290 RepID=A0A3N0BY83_9MICC|nr:MULTISPECIES: APC family permease [Arthrobacter]QYF89238.1 APC family permease [Arthrobacter sp. PAMC25284]RNL54683.1 APC family permease [Arthrobacter oryzae]
MADEKKLSLAGSVSLGTGVMIGAGIFALVGQVAGLAGGLVPAAFLAGAVVVAFSAYSYVKYSGSNPSSGGIAMLLKDAYGPGVIAGSFSLFMYVSMVIAESLLARTFGTYLLRPFGLQGSPVLVPVLGVAAIALAAVVNLVGNRLVEKSATVTAAVKILGIAALAIAGLVAAGPSSLGKVLSGGAGQAPDQGILGFLAGTTLCILAYKGFTTITNQGGDIQEPKKNIGRSIIIALALCTVIYLLLTVSVTGSLTVPEIVEARDYALAEAAEPLFGAWGVGLTIALAVVATLSGLLASIYSVSRLYAMLQDMKQAPGLPGDIKHEPLLITAGLAIIVTVFFDLSQIASLGALLYIAMDIAIHVGVIRHLSGDIGAKRWIPAVAILLDVAVVVPFVLIKAGQDPLTVGIAAAVALVIFVAQWWAVSRRDHTFETTGQEAGS